MSPGRLLQIENDAWTDILTLESGRAASRRRRSSAISNDRAIRRLERDIRLRPNGLRAALTNFLRAAAHRLQNIVVYALEDFDQN